MNKKKRQKPQIAAIIASDDPSVEEGMSRFLDHYPLVFQAPYDATKFADFRWNVEDVIGLGTSQNDEPLWETQSATRKTSELLALKRDLPGQWRVRGDEDGAWQQHRHSISLGLTEIPSANEKLGQFGTAARYRSLDHQPSVALPDRAVIDASSGLSLHTQRGLAPRCTAVGVLCRRV